MCLFNTYSEHYRKIRKPALDISSNADIVLQAFILLSHFSSLDKQAECIYCIYHYAYNSQHYDERKVHCYDAYEKF